jgi:hypothetical protein
VLKAITARWNHLRSIGKWPWGVLAALWSAFWAVDEAVQKWASPAHQAIWKAYTGNVPISRWGIWLIGVLAITAVMLLEGSYRMYGMPRTLGKSARTLERSLTNYQGNKRVVILLPQQGEGENDRRERRKFGGELETVFARAQWAAVIRQVGADVGIIDRASVVLVYYAPNRGQNEPDYAFLEKAFQDCGIATKRYGITAQNPYTGDLSTSDFLIYIGPKN